MEFDFKNEFESMMKSNELDTVVVLGHINRMEMQPVL